MTSKHSSTIKDIDSVLDTNNKKNEIISNSLNEKENETDIITKPNLNNNDKKYSHTSNDNINSSFTSKFNYNSSSKPFTMTKPHFFQQNQPPQHNTNIPYSNNTSIQNNNNNLNNVIMIEIDNLPPNKTWKQIKYLIGGIIHHSNVMQVKILPPMTSYLPPFITIQSCIIALQNTLSNEMINDLISTLNLYSWDNFDLYAYVVPTTTNTYPYNYINYQQNILPQRNNSNPNNNNNVGNTPKNTGSGGSNLPFPFPMLPPAAIYMPQQQQFDPSTNSPIQNKNDTPLTLDSMSQSPSQNIDIENKNDKKIMYPPPTFIPMTSPQQPAGIILSPPNGVALPPPPPPPPPIQPLPGMIPPPTIQFTQPYFPKQQQSQSQQPSHYGTFMPTATFKTRYGGSTATSSNPGSPPNVITGYKRRYSHNQFINPLDMSNEIKENLQESYQENIFPTDPLGASASQFNGTIPYYYPTQTRYNLLNKRNANPFKQPNKLKNIFNEVNFRKQMTERGMFQLKIDNFPPYLLPETETLMTNLKDEIIDIHTDTIEKFGKLRWTILKDFIKLKCPKLLNLRGQFNESIGNNTREFYVGVYEAEETKVIVDINPGSKENNDTETDEEEEQDVFGSNKIVEMEAILYNAIIGFHNKELSDLCLENLQNQEYSLGYKLHVTILPPYEGDYVEEKDRKYNKDEDQVTDGEEEHEDIAQGITNLSISNHTN